MISRINNYVDYIDTTNDYTNINGLTSITAFGPFEIPCGEVIKAKEQNDGTWIARMSLDIPKKKMQEMYLKLNQLLNLK